jgi:signal transduction histidine kinase
VSVQDWGPGLSAEEQESIWNCFYRSQRIKVLSGSGVGLGLGLYISKTLIERHNGQAGVTSEMGVGSIFWFTLPLAQTEEASTMQ